MLTRITFFLAVTAYVQGGGLFRNRRQSCECSPGEEPKCGCQVVASSGTGKPFQMLCSCSQPVPPKCVCREIPTVTRSPVTTTSSPSTLNVRCVDVCKRSCQEPCSRLSSGSKCGQVCSEACGYSCSKQNKSHGSNSVVTEYKFVLPSTPPPLPTLIPSPAPVVGNFIVSATSKVCEPACMPQCDFICTTFKPALKLITDAVDGKTSTPAKCRKECGETCIKMCSATGVSLMECVNHCEICADTCGLVAKTKTCITQCQPECTDQCIQIQTELEVPGAVFPQPAVMISATSSPLSPVASALCQNECAVQCESQCTVHSLAGPQCLAACQTTCYPVCQQRRTHRKPVAKKEH